MSRSTATPQGSILPPAESLFEFRKNLLSILSKFSDTHTTKQGMTEMRQFMTQDITDNDRMNCFLSAISDQNEHMKPQQKKEQIKIFGLAAEIFEDALLPFMPKILTSLQKKLKEGTTQIHEAVSDALGQLVFYIINKVEEYDEKRELLDNFFKLPMQMLEKSPNKNVQGGAAQCLSKVVQNCPEDVLIDLLEEITDKMIAIMNLNQFKAHTPLLECIISLVFHVEQDFTPFAPKFLPVLIEFIACNDQSTKKVAIDAIYSMTAIIKEEIIPYRLDILQVLNHCRFDKYKPVREATLETIKLIKDIGPPLDDEQLALIEDKPVKNKPTSVQGNLNINRDRNSGSKSARPQRREFLQEDANFSTNVKPVNKDTSQLSSQKRVPIKELKKGMQNIRESQKSTTSVGRVRDDDQDSVQTLQTQSTTSKNEKKVSTATLKRRAAQSPMRNDIQQNGFNDGDVSPNSVKKEFKSALTGKKNANFFKDQQDIAIFEGKKPDNFEELLVHQPKVVEISNSNKEINSQNSSDVEIKNRKNSREELKSKGNASDGNQLVQKKQQARGKFQKPPVQNKTDAFDNIVIYEPKGQVQQTTRNIDDTDRQKDDHIDYIESSKVKLKQPSPHKFKYVQEQEESSNTLHNRDVSRDSKNNHQENKHNTNLSFNGNQNSKEEGVYSYRDSTQDLRSEEQVQLRKSISTDIHQHNRNLTQQNSYSDTQSKYEKENLHEETSYFNAKKNSEDYGAINSYNQNTGYLHNRYDNYANDEYLNRPSIDNSSQNYSNNQNNYANKDVGLRSNTPTKSNINVNQLLMDTMKTFQDQVKLEMSQVKSKVIEFERQLLEVKLLANSKVNAEEVKDIINKNMGVLSTYKQSADNITSSLRNIPGLQSQNFINSQQNIIDAQNLLNKQNILNNNFSLLQPQQFDNHLAHNISFLPTQQQIDFQTQNNNQLNTQQDQLIFDRNENLFQNPNLDLKKQMWSIIQGMIQRQQYNDAFLMALNSDDEMLLIRLLSKTGSFEFEKLQELQREELIKKTMQLLENKEFIEILLPCLSEAVERFHIIMSLKMRENIAQKLNRIKADREFSEIQKMEIKRILDKIIPNNLQ
eukprot:403353082